jgi:hypothetical protein
MVVGSGPDVLTHRKVRGVMMLPTSVPEFSYLAR